MTDKIDSVFRTRSLGVGAAGIPDQYADGKAANVWHLYIGGNRSRTAEYRDWVCNYLRQKNCKTVLDVACGTGVDSMMLLEEGFKVTSVDASDKMLKYALKERWNRRKEDAFDNWVIEEANWLTLDSDMEEINGGEKFDAVICLGNSFAHLPDFSGDQKSHRISIGNFEKMVKPGGILLIDHRNYDAILDSGTVPARNIYYKSERIKGITTSVLYVNNGAQMITLDYVIDASVAAQEGDDISKLKEEDLCKFRLSYYPHRLEQFTNLLKTIFPEGTRHSVYGDFKEYNKADNPAYYVHLMVKPLQ